VPLIVAVVAAAVLVPVLLSGDSDSDSGGRQAKSGGPEPTSVPSSGGSGGGSPSATAWQAPQDRSIGLYTLNSYLAEGQVIIVGEQKVVAYDQTTGKRKWSMAAPPAEGYEGSGSIWCGTSTHIVDGMLALTFGTDSDCALVAAIDVSSGHLAWTEQVIPPGSASFAVPPAMLVEIVGDSVIVGFDNQLGGYELSNGRYLGWHIIQDRDDKRFREKDTCPISDLVVVDDTHAYFTTGCLLSNVFQYGILDTKAKTVNGKEVGPKDMPFKVQALDIVSANPLVLLFRSDHFKTAEYRFFDTNFTLVGRVRTGSSRAADGLDISDINFSLPPGTFHNRWRAMANDKTFVAITNALPDKANKLVGYDVSTGKQSWSMSIADARIYGPIAFDGDDVLVAAGAQAGKGTLDIVRVSTADGAIKATTHAPATELTNNANYCIATQFAWADGRAYGAVSARGSLSAVFDGPQVFSFGA
jgi:hypothetical protein